MPEEQIALASDHGGFRLKEHLKKYLEQEGYAVKDLGTYSEESCDYPDIAEKLGAEVTKEAGECRRGILICGTGIGISIAANKIKGIRAALCGDVYSAQKSREHNDAHVLCLGGRVLGTGLAELICRTFLNTAFAGGRHARRVAKIAALEEKKQGGCHVDAGRSL